MATPVTYVMPVLNEEAHIGAAIESLLAQDYEGDFEVILALGPSIDDTDRIVAEMARDEPRILRVPNEIGSTPSGLNVAIRAAQHPIIIRVDAHSVLPPEYTRIAVETLEASGAVNVGGIMKAEGVTAFERAVARAYGAPEGLGGTPHHSGGAEGPADTAYLGTFTREALFEVGLFDEDIKRGQDWELNKRLRQAGGVVWFTPRLEVVYRPRSSLRKLVRQVVATGIWRGELARRFGASNGLRYFVPPVAVIGIVVGLVAGIVGLTGLGTPDAAASGIHWWGWLTLLLVAPAVYLLFVLWASLRAALAEGPGVGAWYLVVLPCIHFGWGGGFILGFLQLTRNITAHTGR